MAEATTTPECRVNYRLLNDALMGGVRIERAEAFGSFPDRDAARQHMIDTQAARKARDACPPEAFANVERSARTVMEHFGGDAGAWTFDGHPIGDDVADALLGLHDHLNDIDRARVADGGARG